MKKLIKSHKWRKKLDFLIISISILAFLAISPADASFSSLGFFSSLEIGHTSAQIYSKTLEVGNL